MIAIPLPKPMGYSFADLTLDLRQRRLSRGEQPIRLSRLTFEMLRTLVELAPAVVPRNELAERVWRGRYVSPETLTQRIRLLRRALSDVARAPRYIEAVRGHGYRVEPQVRPLAEPSCKPALAVLPFEVISHEPNSGLFAAGMHEEIVSRMARLPALDVLARGTVRRYEHSRLPIGQIAAELGVHAVIEGSVRYATDRIRITAQLIDAASSAHLWAEVFDCARGDDLEIQSYVAQEIANAFGLSCGA